MNKSLGKKIEDHGRIVDFMLAGKAWFALKSLKTGTVYQYKVNAAKSEFNTPTTAWWVKVLLSNHTETSSPYKYTAGLYLKKHMKTPDLHINYRTDVLDPDHPEHQYTVNKMAAFRWFWDNLVRGTLPTSVEFYHIGRCAKCGHKLTTEKSIELGFGPNCWKQHMTTSLYVMDEIYNEPYRGRKNESDLKPLWIIQHYDYAHWMNCAGTVRESEKEALLLLAECRTEEPKQMFRVKSFKE